MVDHTVCKRKKPKFSIMSDELLALKIVEGRLKEITEILRRIKKRKRG